MKSEVDKFDIGKLRTTPDVLSKLSNVVENVVKKISTRTTDTSTFVKKAEYNTKIEEIEKEISDHAIYVTTQEFNKIIADNFTARLAQTKLTTKMILLIS